MSRFLIVGHNSTKAEELEKELIKCGMYSSNRSVKYNYASDEVIQKILDACEISGSEPRSSEAYSDDALLLFTQVKPQKMWDHLLFDFYLANSDRRSWLWENSKAIRLLDYLSKFDEDLYFILVYDEPHQALADLFNNNSSSVSKNEVIYKLNEWFEYNQSLLKFKKENYDKCLLVNGAYTINVKRRLLDELEKKANISIETTDIDSPETITIDNDFSLLLDYLVYKEFGLQDFYNELVLESDISNNLEVKAPDLLNMDSILKILNDASAIKTLSSTNEKLSLRNESLVNDIQEYKDLNNSLRQQCVALQDKIDTNLRLISDLTLKNNNVEGLKNSDYKILLAQMHAMQSQMEDLYLENFNLTNKENFNHTTAITKYKASPEIVKNDISYRLGSIIIENSKSARSITSVPKLVIKEYKEYNKRLKNKEVESLEMFEDSEATLKVKRHLKYQVGEVVADSLDTPIKLLGLPPRVLIRALKFKLRKK